MAASVKDMFSLEGHTAVVTGGTRGIGQAVAVALAEAGADILLVQVNKPRPEARPPKSFFFAARRLGLLFC